MNSDDIFDDHFEEPEELRESRKPHKRYNLETRCKMIEDRIDASKVIVLDIEAEELDLNYDQLCLLLDGHTVMTRFGTVRLEDS